MRETLEAIARLFMENVYLIIIILDVLLSIIIVFRERKQTSSTWAWLLVLIFLPVVGFILYLFLGRGISRVRLFDLKMQSKIGLHDELEEQKKEILKGNYPHPPTGEVDPRQLIYMLSMYEGAIYAKNATLQLFTDGRQKFDALIKDIKEAKEHINFEYYIFRKDNLGTEVYQALLGAAKRGVKVRVLLDAWGSNGVKIKDFKELREAGGQVVFFFPLFLPWINPRLNYRNHRKIVVIDGEIGYTGGFNVGDEYLGIVKKFGYWRDNHIRMTGEGVYSLQNRFIMDWNSQHTNEIKHPANYFPPVRVKGNKQLQVVTSGPDSDQEQIKMTYLKMINMAKKEILIQTPYYIPDESIHEALKSALMGGIKVRMQIPNKPDHMLVYWATYSFAAELLDYGATIETYEKGFIHAKTMVIDGGITSIGSANIDNRSFTLDFEVNTVVYDSEFSEKVRHAFYLDTKDCKPLTKEIYENRSRVIKFKESLARLISPLL
ncbi:MAG: cardiolipin synthase [Lactobacillales bacterium]|jgi:cardiolipin synthase|nr:cardiolipin synthase [Lactobacillales bacterium]